MHASWVLALKDLKLLLRQPVELFFTLGWPLITAILFGIVFSGGGGQSAKPRVSVVDLDGTPGAAAFVEQLRALPEFEVDVVAAEAAPDLVRTGKRTAAVVVPAGFGDASKRVFYGESPRVELLIDPSRKAEQAMLGGMLQKVAGAGLSRRLTDAGQSREWIAAGRADIGDLPEAERATFARFFDSLESFTQNIPPASAGGGPAREADWQPLAVEVRSIERRRSGPANAFGVTFPQGMVWGIVGVLMSFATALVLERVQGTMTRLRASPMSSAQILLGKALACFLAILGMLAVLTTVGVVGFGVRPGAPGLLLLTALVAAFAFTGLMMLLSNLGSTVAAVSGVGWAAMMPLMLFGGGMMPLFLMPAWMQSASSISPIKWAVLAFEGAIWRGFSFAELLLPLGILLVFGAVCLAAGARLMARRFA
jgi:ABC-2 type transport system permease protein